MSFILRLVFVSLAIVFQIPKLWSQCSIPAGIPTTDLTTRVGYIRVTGAINNDLSNPGQGICGIHIRFRHASVGDLRLRLFTPSNQVLNLVESKGSRSTDGTTWDIRFVPCATSPMPDQNALIKPVWDSDQNWGENNSYTGTYHPQQCLETINRGPVNGLWTLQVTDFTQLGSGEIESFIIEFCDQQGIMCSTCELDAGRITIDTIPVCGGDPSLGAIRLFPTFTGEGPNPSLYDYLYAVVAEDGTVVDITAVPDLTGYSKGFYRLQGISVLREDLPLLLGYIGESLARLSGIISIFQPDFCATFSTGYRVYEILSDAGTIHRSQLYVCDNSPIAFDNQTITEPGTYSATLTSSQGCDSLVELVVLAFEARSQINDPGIMTCSNKPLTLSWTNSQFPMTPKYRWSTVDGSILGQNQSNNIQIDLPGTYNLQIAQGGCADTLDITITDDGSLPDLDLTDVVMDCSSNVGNLRPVTDATSFSWVGPNGFTANTRDVDVTEPGNYTITAVGANCAVRKTIQVSANFDRPGMTTVTGGTLRCANDSVQLKLEVEDQDISIAWRGPVGFTSSDQNPWVKFPGVYIVRIERPNGCANEESVDVINIFQEPSVQITGVTLDCERQSGRISTQINDNRSAFQWTGPGGFTSQDQSPLVNMPGMYQVTITDSRQCEYQATTTVDVDTIAPTVAASDIQLDCSATTFTLGAIYTSLHDARFVWTGPNGYIARELDAVASQAGRYSITVIDQTNQCLARTSINVWADPDQPELETESGALNCAQNQDTLILGISNCSGCMISWSGPGGFTSDNDTVIVGLEGEYRAEVVSSSGCRATGFFNVVENTIPRPKMLRSIPIGCTTPGRAVLDNFTTFASLFWIDSITSERFDNARFVDVSQPTTLFLVATDRNHCTDTQRVEIALNDQVPDFDFLLDTINCANSQVNIAVRTRNYSLGQIAQYEWTLPDGNATNSPIAVVDESGDIRLRLTMRNGCVGAISGTVPSDFSTPDLEALGGSFSCSGPGQQLDYISETAPLLTQWRGPGGYRSTFDRPVVNVPGLYTLDILGSNGCPARDTALVTYSDPLPTLDLAGDTITCYDTIGNIGFVTNAVNPIFRWIDPGGRVNLNQDIATTLVGLYQLELTDQNGCEIRGMVSVEIDTISVGQVISSDLISCHNPLTVLKIDTIHPQITYQWLFDSIVISDKAEPAVDLGGSYQLVTTNQNGCTRIIDHIVEADTVRPVFSLTGDTLDCSTPRLNLIPAPRSGTWKYDWTGPDGFTSDRSLPLITEPGVYRLTTEGRNGCRFEESVVIGSDQNVPEVFVENTFIPCNGNPATLVYTSPDAPSEISWFGPNGFFQQDSIVQTLMAGLYFLIAKGDNGCERLDSLVVSGEPNLEVPEIDSQNVDCTHNLATLEVVDPRPEFTYVWSDPLGNTLTDTVLETTIAGTYIIESIHEPSNCRLIDSIQVLIDTAAPMVSAFTLDSIVCDHRRILLESETNEVVLYQWSTDSGSIVSDPEGSSVWIDSVGLYQLLVTNPRNSCTNQTELLVLERPHNLNGLELEISDASCYGDNNGLILINRPVGGSEPYLYSLDGGMNFTQSTTFQNLVPDTFELTVMDVNGCLYDSTVVVGRLPRFDLDIGLDTSIQLGDSLTLTGQVSLSDSLLGSVTWYLPDRLDCLDCLEQSIKPLESTVILVKVQSQYGCVEWDTMLVTVSDQREVFVPNAFTPNGDGINDFVEVFPGTNIVEIEVFEIFDRWGNNVFGASNFVAGDIVARWDGNYRNQPLNPGLFVYLLKARDVRGEIKHQVGEISLVR